MRPRMGLTSFFSNNDSRAEVPRSTAEEYRSTANALMFSELKRTPPPVNTDKSGLMAESPGAEQTFFHWDLTVRADAFKLMSASDSEYEWNRNCDRVKAANQGYPTWWFEMMTIDGALEVAKDTYNW